MYLEKIQSPEDLRKISKDKLPVLANEIREEIVNTITNNGGHLASNLGVVELTIALHYVFDTPKDKIIFDVGHQVYTHKLLTNRKDKFNTIRQKGGLSGFSSAEESEYDTFISGHASTSLSLACGLARARTLKNDNFEIISVIGDGSLSGGMVFEAINDLYNINGKQIWIINDNSMSISKTVGYIPQILNRIDRISKKGKIPTTNCEYYSGINGHDFNQLIDMFTYAKNTDNNVIIHINTVKGRGYRPAELDPLTYHGIPSSNDTTGALTFSKQAGTSLAEVAKTNTNIVAVTAAMLNSVGLHKFSQLYPNRVFDVGICESHAVTMCSGMTALGIKPYFMVYSSFLQRGFDQVIHDVCLENLPVTFLVDRAGFVCDDGKTHQGIYDLSFFNSLPNMTILAPKDTSELDKMIKWSVDFNKPLVIRYPKGDLSINYEINENYSNNDVLSWEYLHKCDNNRVVIATGARMCELAYKGLSTIQNSEKYSIINARCIKPLDEKMLNTLKNKNIVVLEDSLKNGGLYSSILVYLNEHNIKCKISSISICYKMPSIGTVSELQQECGITVENILNKLK